MTHIQESTDIFRIEYTQADSFMKEQLKVFWTADEIQVEKDIHDILTNCTEAERHGIFTVLKLFTLYELRAGADYWTGRFMKSFPRHELASMGAAFGMMELCVHKPFYNKINELLNATNDSFYTDYINNPILKERMGHIDEIINNPDDLTSLAGFSMVEGVILYSSFAFLKHFQSLGKNKLINVVRGINFSVRDENLHSIAGAWTFRELLNQSDLGINKLQLIDNIHRCADKIYEHECAIIDMIFEKGDIPGINASDLKFFVASRINICFNNLGLSPWSTDIQYNPISEWFYKGINNYQFNDFFTGQGREYTRDWSEDKFVW